MNATIIDINTALFPFNFPSCKYIENTRIDRTATKAHRNEIVTTTHPLFILR